MSCVKNEQGVHAWHGLSVVKEIYLCSLLTFVLNFKTEQCMFFNFDSFIKFEVHLN